MTVLDIHARLGNTALFFALIMGAWGLWRFFRRQGVDSSYWGALAIAEGLFLIQAALGAYLWIGRGGGAATSPMHILYGVITVLVVPGVFLYTRGDEHRRVSLIYGVAFLFLVGILLRSMATA